jgi:hypothetical protein
MAGKLVSYYDKAKEIGGLKAQMRLAVLTGLPSTKASEAPDSPENIAKFDSAMAEINNEFK